MLSSKQSKHSLFAERGRMETRVEERGRCLENQQLPLIGVAAAFPSLPECPSELCQTQCPRQGDKLQEGSPAPHPWVPGLRISDKLNTNVFARGLAAGLGAHRETLCSVTFASLLQMGAERLENKHSAFDQQRDTVLQPRHLMGRENCSSFLLSPWQYAEYFCSTNTTFLKGIKSLYHQEQPLCTACFCASQRSVYLKSK